MADIKFSGEDDKYIYVDVSVVPPDTRVYLQVDSTAKDRSTDTSDIAGQLQLPSNDNGDVRFRLRKLYFLDREGESDIRVGVSFEVASAVQTFAA